MSEWCWKEMKDLTTFSDVPLCTYKAGARFVSQFFLLWSHTEISSTNHVWSTFPAVHTAGTSCPSIQVQYRSTVTELTVFDTLHTVLVQYNKPGTTVASFLELVC